MKVSLLKQLLPDPFLGHWLTTELFPFFSQGLTKFNTLTIQGSLKELSNMGQEKNRDAFELDMTLEDMDISLEKPDVVFKNSSGRLRIKGGKLVVSDIKGTMAGTVVQLGSYQIDDLYDDEVTSRFTIEGHTSINDLAKLSSISFMPEHLKKDGQFLKGYTGQVQTLIQAHFTPPYNSIHFDRFDTKIRKVSSKKLFWGSPIVFDEISIHRDAHSKNVLSGSGKWDTTNFQIAGFFKDDANGSVTVETQLALPLLIPFIEKSKLPLFFTKHEKTYPSKFDIHKHPDGFRLESHITLPELPMISCTDTGRSLLDGDLVMNLTTKDWRRLTIEKFALSYDQYQINGTGKGDLDEMKMTMSLQSPKTVHYVNNQGQKEKETRKSPLNTDLTMDIDLNHPEKSRVFGILQSQSLSCPLPGITSRANDLAVDLIFTGQRVDLNTFDFFLNSNPDSSPLRVKGFVEHDENLKGVLLVDGDSIHWNDILDDSEKKRKKENKTEEEHALSGERGIIISAKINQLNFRETLISPFYLQGYLANDGFYPTQIAARMKNGRLGLTTLPGENKKKNLKFSFFLDNQDITGLNHFFSYNDNRDMKGRLTAGGMVYARGNTMEKLHSRLNGDIMFHIQEATLKGDYILVRILELLSIENLFSKKADYAEKGDLYLKSLSGNLSMDNSVLTSSDIFVDTIAFDATGDLKIDLQKQSIESHLAVSPFGTVDTIVSTIPIIGHILTGKDKSLVSYHLQIKGPLYKPKITYVPLEDIPSSLLGYGKRLLSPSTYLFFLNDTEKGLDYDRISQTLVTEIEKRFDTNINLLKGR